MKKNLFILAFLAFSFAFFCEEGGAHHSGGWMTPIWGIPMIIWQIANLILVIALFYYLLRVKLPAFLRARRTDIEKALNRATEERILAEKKLKELEEKLINLDNEVKEIIKEAEKNAEKEREILRRNAEESANWLKREAEEEFKRKQIETERRIKEFAVNEAVEIARKIISKHFEERDRERVFSEFVSDIKDKLNG
ncbi:MAG: ATP synthase F0 subunit B [Acidobacteria bacterium]|nr:ATP synthase F0 subunit B [Acidobacteriota bacterium]